MPGFRRAFFFCRDLNGRLILPVGSAAFIPLATGFCWSVRQLLSRRRPASAGRLGFLCPARPQFVTVGSAAFVPPATGKSVGLSSCVSPADPD